MDLKVYSSHAMVFRSYLVWKNILLAQTVLKWSHTRTRKVIFSQDLKLRKNQRNDLDIGRTVATHERSYCIQIQTSCQFHTISARYNFRYFNLNWWISIRSSQSHMASIERLTSRNPLIALLHYCRFYCMLIVLFTF